jgi:hypothetical protein
MVCPAPKTPAEKDISLPASRCENKKYFILSIG